MHIDTTADVHSALLLMCLCAGLLDAESSLSERSDHFFSELRSFRQVNKEECVHSVSTRSEGKPPVATSLCFFRLNIRKPFPSVIRMTFCRCVCVRVRRLSCCVIILCLRSDNSRCLEKSLYQPDYNPSYRKLKPGMTFN